MFKSVVFHERRPELSRAQFMDYWLKVHAPMSEGTRGLYGYACNEIIQDVTLKTTPALQVGADVDGIAHMWFKTPDGLVTLPKAQPNVQRWFADGPNFIGRRVRFMGEEIVITAPQRDSASTPKLVVLASTNSDKSEEGSEVQDRLLGALLSTRITRRGCAITRILSDHLSNNITGFPMGGFDYVVEIWLCNESLADDAATNTVEALKGSLSSARAFLARENVIQAPADG